MPKRIHILIRDDDYNTAQFFLRRKEAYTTLDTLKQSLISTGGVIMSDCKKAFTIYFGNHSFQSHYRVISRKITVCQEERPNATAARR